MRAVVLAGGRGVRLQPFTFTIPKPLLPVGEKPLLEEVILRLKAFGFDEVIIAVGYLGELIESYFGDGSRLGVNLQYAREPKPLGTAGPLALIAASFELPADQPILVMNGDILTNLRLDAFLEFHRRKGFDLTVATRLSQLQHPYGLIQTRGEEIIDIAEKPTETHLISAGLYLLQPPALAAIPGDCTFDFPDLINKLVAEGGRVGSYTFDESWLAIDRLQDLEEAVKVAREQPA